MVRAVSRLPGSRPKVLGLCIALLILFAVSPILVGDSAYTNMLIFALLFAILAASWDITFGYAGVLNFAQVALFALGAYTTSILTVRYGVTPWFGVAAGAAVATIAGVLTYVPVMRLRGIYVALVTFAFSQLSLRVILATRDFTGGAFGLPGVVPLSIGGYSFVQDTGIGYFYVALVLFLVTLLCLGWLVRERSAFGSSLIALRDYEEYAVSRGIPIGRQRLLAFAASAVFTGAAGAIYADYTQVASPELFGFSYTTLLLSMILIGGVGTLFGPVVGAFILTPANELFPGAGPWRFAVVAILTILVLRFLRGGLWGSAGSALRWWARRRGKRPPLAADPSPHHHVETTKRQ